MLGLEYHPDTVVDLQWLLYVKSCKYCLKQANIDCMYSMDIPVQHLIPKMESLFTLSPNLPNLERVDVPIVSYDVLWFSH